MRFIFRALWRLVRFVLLLALCAVLLAGSILGVLGHREYEQALAALPPQQMQAAIIGQEHFVPLSALTQTYLDAVISVEDSRFYLHNGFDPLAVLRAVRNNIQARKLREGGSTITQQLAKNQYFTQEASAVRKAAEIFMALKLEKVFSKREILEMYINSIYYGSGYYCVYDASRGYFGRDPDQLSDYQATLLAGIPNAPSVYSPDVNPQLAHERQWQVLLAMINNDKLTEEEAEAIFNGE